MANMENEVDVVIVGSGISGCVMAKTLTQAGKRVLLLEAGLEAGISLDVNGSYQNYMYYLDTFYKAAAKVPNSPYPDLAVAPSIDVLQIQQPTNPADPNSYLVQMGPVPFGSDCLRGAGGTTMHWLGSTPRMLPNDFQMQTKYGRGVDWPFDYETLVPYYEMAEFEIGISGDVEDLQNIPNAEPMDYGTDYHFPMKKIPNSYLDQVVQKQLPGDKRVVKSNGKEYTLKFVTTPQGRNSIPNPAYEYRDIMWDRVHKKLRLQKAKYWNHKTKQFEVMAAGGKYEYLPVGAVWDPNTGQRCEGNASCVPICPVQAKYNALKTLRKANHQKMEIKTQAVASRILFDPETGEVTGIEYKVYRYENSIVYDTYVARGKKYVLATSAIENAKIMLASGAKNVSGELGCNLMDHLCMLVWGLLPEGSPGYPYRGPGSTTNIPTFRDGDFRKDHTAWILPIDNWGWAWPTFSPGSDLGLELDAGNFGETLRKNLASKLTRQVFFHHECEQDPQRSNRVTIDGKYRDPLGNYRPVIHYDLSTYVKDAFVAAQEVTNQLFANAEIEDYTNISEAPALIKIDYQGYTYKYGGAGHIVGTHRMGTDESNSVVDADGRSWGHKNLFLVGCGNMPTLGTSNPTLTMTALTFKTAEAILKELDQQ